MPTWLPGVGSEFGADEGYFLDFLHGDPYARLEAGEARLPGDINDFRRKGVLRSRLGIHTSNRM